MLRRSRRALRVAADRQLLRFVNGLAYFTAGASRAEMGNAPKRLVHKAGKLEVHRIDPHAGHDHFELTRIFDEEPLPDVATPVLLIPPLMARPYVYDLRPEHSMARTLRHLGLDTYVLDFGVPDEGDAGLRLDDYVLDFVPQAVEAVRAQSGARDVTLAGYCMGGIFALLYAAAHRDAPVRNIVTIGAPIDFEKMGALTLVARLGSAHIDKLMDRLGNVPGTMASQGFKLMSGAKSITRYADLFIHLYDEEYVRGFDAINTWVNDLIPYPREAFKQMVKDVVSGNKILGRTLELGGRNVDLRDVRVPLLAFAGAGDNIAPLESARAIVDLVGAEDKRFVEVPGGHVGVVAGNAAPAAVWRPTAAWITEHA